MDKNVLDQFASLEVTDFDHTQGLIESGFSEAALVETCHFSGGVPQLSDIAVAEYKNRQNAAAL